MTGQTKVVKKGNVHYLESDKVEDCPCERAGEACGERFTMAYMAMHFQEDHTIDEVVGALVGITFLSNLSNKVFIKTK